MAQDSGVFHGLPIMGTLKSPGRYSPTSDNHPKQPQHHFSPCTTQASPPAMADDHAGPFSGACTLSFPLSPLGLETPVPGELPCSPQSPVSGLDAAQHGGGLGAAQQELMLADMVPKQEYHPEDLQHRIKDMWPSQPSGTEDCDDELGMLRRRASDTAVGLSSSQPAHHGQGNDGSVRNFRGWPDTQNTFQQPFPWNPLPASTQFPLNPSMCYSNRPSPLDDPGTTSYGPFDEIGDASQSWIRASPSIQPFSPNGLPFYEAGSAMPKDGEGTVACSEGDIEHEYKDPDWWPNELLGGSPSSIEAPGTKVDEPYAQLIYRAFMSRPNKSMTLQEIYTWFRENTDKAKAEGKGWQNSIRHNLSMNGAFTKRNSKTPLNSNADGSLSMEPSRTGPDGRKSTEWYLEPIFYTGVESTTRYRKGNSSSRSRAAAAAAGGGGHPGRSRLGSNGHAASSGFSQSRIQAGRKGGNVAAQNRKHRQQHARDMARTHPRQQQHQQQHLHMSVGGGGGGGFAGAQLTYPAPATFDGSDPAYNFHPAAAYHHSVAGAATQPQVFPALSAFSGGGASSARMPTDTMMGYNFFRSDDVGRDPHMKRSRTLATDNEEHAEPRTPPGLGCLDAPRVVEDLFGGGGGGGGGDGRKHGGFLPDMGSSYNPLNSYQHPLGHMGIGGGGGGAGGGGGDMMHGQAQQHAYSLRDVTGIYDPPAGSHQPPLFIGDGLFDPEDPMMANLHMGE